MEIAAFFSHYFTYKIKSLIRATMGRNAWYFLLAGSCTSRIPQFRSSSESLLNPNFITSYHQKERMKPMLNEKSCGAVVYAKNSEIKYLLLQYEAGHWDFVKGNVEKGENEKETTVRELGEETGITTAKFIENFREKIGYFYKRQGATVYKEVVFFLMESPTIEVKLSFEHIGYAWLTYDAAMEKLTFKNARDVLTKARDYLTKQGLLK
jgi:bis(5'-nucleosidyl)-tetraphosphatase